MQSSSLLFNQFSLMLSYITTVQLSKLRSKHWYNTVNWSLIWDLPVSSVTYFFFPSIQSHIVFSWYIYLVVSNQRLSLSFSCISVKNIGQSLIECISIWGWWFLMVIFKVSVFGRIPHSDVTFSVLHHTTGQDFDTAYQWWCQPWSLDQGCITPYASQFGSDLVARSCPTLATPWMVACRAPLSMGFPRQDYWSGLPCLHQGIFPTQGWNPGLHFWQVLYQLSHQGSHNTNILYFQILPHWWILSGTKLSLGNSSGDFLLFFQH